MISIKTPRLELIPLDHSMLQIWKKQGREKLETTLNLTSNSWEVEKFYEVETFQALENFWIPKTYQFPLDFLWYTNWEIIWKEKSCSVGGIGLSGLPDNEGKSEIGYVIDQKYRNLGIATEAVKNLIQWASQDEGLLFITAETPLENQGSQKVLINNGFEQKGNREIFVNEMIPLICWEKKIQKREEERR
jgi:RimJ/RimL family protein N-acetyltransferase